MVKTQIQLPEELYCAMKDFAAKREWSLAEAFRRGAEKLMETYPSDPISLDAWDLPEPKPLGCYALDADDLKRLAQEDPDGLSVNR